MKVMLILIVLFYCISCTGQPTRKEEVPMKLDSKKVEAPAMDTLKKLSLIGHQYGAQFQVLHLSDSVSGEKKIRLVRDGKEVASFSLPRADDEVKNFSVSKMEQASNGFTISVDWGGGRYFYGRQFYFTYRDNLFYLDRVTESSYTEGSEKEKLTTRRVQPPVPINRFSINHYIENE